MNEILPGVFHWTTLHEGHRSSVSSYLPGPRHGGRAIDPQVPDEGMGWFEAVRHPRPFC